MSAVPKADVQNVGVGIVLNVCFWPKAAVREKRFKDFLYDRLWQPKVASRRRPRKIDSE